MDSKAPSYVRVSANWGALRDTSLSSQLRLYTVSVTGILWVAKHHQSRVSQRLAVSGWYDVEMLLGGEKAAQRVCSAVLYNSSLLQPLRHHEHPNPRLRWLPRLCERPS